MFITRASFFRTKAAAEEQLKDLKSIATRDGWLSVAEWHTIIGSPHSEANEFDYGWSKKTIENLKVETLTYPGMWAYAEYVIRMPEAESTIVLDKNECFRPKKKPNSGKEPNLEIVDERDVKSVRFKDIDIGGTFERMGDLFIKVNDLESFNLNYKYLTGTIENNELVRPVNVKITISN